MSHVYEQEILTKKQYDEMVEFFIDELRSKDTINTYKRFFQDFYDFMKNDKNECVFCIDGLMRYRKYINVNKPDSVKNLNTSAIRSFIKFLNQKHVLKRIHPEDLTPFKKAPRRNARNTLNGEIIDQLITKTQDEKEELLLQILFYSGARKDSVRVLEKDNFQKNSDDTYTLFFDKNVKGSKPYSVKIPATKIIDKFLQKDKPKYLFHSPRDNNRPISSSSFHDFLDKIVNRIEWNDNDKPSFHYFRH